MNIPKVLISYSWDNELHKSWVVDLMNRLRGENIDAEIDRSITQQGTTNLNRMMVEKVRDNDFIIVVLTENYKERAENYQGGVGLETTLIQNEILNNTKKIIPIKRSKEDDSRVIPYYLQGLNYTDFSSDDRFEESLLELIHRIKGIDIIEVSPIGTGRDLKPEKIEYNPKITEDNMLYNSLEGLIPDLVGITDLDKKKFIIKSFDEIKKALIQLCEVTKSKNHNFDFELEELSGDEFKISFYVNGINRKGVRIWYGSMFGGKDTSINISYDNFGNYRNSFNEMISCEVNNNILALKMMSYVKNINDTNDIVKVIWENICIYLR